MTTPAFEAETSTRTSKPTGTTAPAHREPNNLKTLEVMLSIAAALYTCYRMSLPFLDAITWAMVLAVLCHPLHRRLATRIRHPNLAATLSLTAVALIVVVPIAVVGQQLIREAVNGIGVVTTKVESGEWRNSLESQPRLAPIARWIELHVDIEGTTKTVSNWLTSTATNILTGSVVQAISVCLTFYLLFFFIRDGRAALGSIRSLSPLERPEMDRVFSRIADTIYATVYGTLAVSAVQGLLGGLMFWWLGLDASFLWGVVMAFLSVVPVLGAVVVWAPAAVFLALGGSWIKAIVLTLWGALIVGGIDNVLRPMLVGSRLKLHTILAFISVVGGVSLFGPVGLVLGPVALTVTVELLEIWRARG